VGENRHKQVDESVARTYPDGMHATVAAGIREHRRPDSSHRPRRSAPIVLDEEEMYGEFFDIPAPDELVFLSTFSGGEVFRSGCTFRRGRGKIFYFRPGDQEYPTFHHPDVRRVIANGVEWAAGDRPERTLPTLRRYETGELFPRDKEPER
jgi:trehalose utilization protein